MENIKSFILVIVVALWLVSPAALKAESDINAKVAQLDIETATLDDVIQIFGEPTKYIWGKETFTKDNLPSRYIAMYPNDFHVFIFGSKINELRFESPAAGYLFKEKLQVGSSLDEVLNIIGQPTKTIHGQPIKFEDGVLYKDIDGRKGYCYYERADQNVRIFFLDYKVKAIYVTRSSPAEGRTISPKKAQHLTAVNEFDDVRWKNLSKIDLSDKKGLIATLTFNQKTIWPEQAKMSPGSDPNKILTNAMNPGLGVRELHQQGITGKGVNVAIIDQPLYQDHPEFASKIVAYHDTGCGTESSMHGPAVASLLVGANCGTAPDARVYYAAAPSWKRDAAYYAKGLGWIITQNEKLPEGEKIRVVSVSASPNQPSWANRQMWDEACGRAEAAGIMVLDCTNNSHRGFIGRCWYNARVPESVAQCNPWAPPNKEYKGKPMETNILVPSCPRTTAEEYDKGDCSYQYCGKGGLSWSIPYCAGVLAMGWQIRPDLTPEQMRELLLKSGFNKKNGAKIINPKRFIYLVKKEKVPPVTRESRQ